ncbi:MAG: hypothetical protein JSU04_18560 [Bdellovibrionales bacterium]|nr:hypothetical protein [Bdellovibrionales bacterium]
MARTILHKVISLSSTKTSLAFMAAATIGGGAFMVYQAKYATPVDSKVLASNSPENALRHQPILKPEDAKFIQGLMPTLQSQAAHDPNAMLLAKVMEFGEKYRTAQNATDANAKTLAVATVRSTSASLKAAIDAISRQPKLAKAVKPELLDLAKQAVTLASNISSSEKMAVLPAILDFKVVPGLEGSKKDEWHGSSYSYGGGKFRGKALFNPPPVVPAAAQAAAIATVTCTPVNLVDPSPTGEALTGSDLYTERSTEVMAAAQQLSSPEAVFAFVRDQIQFIPHFGATQTATQVIQSGTGSSADKATLLIALLRAKNIPAHYVMGEVFLNSHDTNSVFHVVGDKPIYWAFHELLAEYFQDSNGNFDLNRIAHSENGQNIYHLPQVWVRAYIDGKWLQLDPMSLPHDLSLGKITQIPIGDSTNEWLFLPDANGLYVKNYSLTDELMRRGNSAVRGVLGANASLSDIGIIDNGAMIVPASSKLLQNLPGVRQPCIYEQANSIPNSYQYFSELRLGHEGDTTYSLLRVKMPSPKIRDLPLAISHTTGVIGQSSSQADGNLQIRLGDQILASTPMAFKDAYDYIHYFRDPEKYYKSVDFRKWQGRAGQVQVINRFMSPVNQAEINREVQRIQALRANPATRRQEIMTGLLRLAAQMNMLRNGESERDMHRLRATGGTGMYAFTASSAVSRVIAAGDRALGVIPSGVYIDESGQFRDYPAAGDYASLANYQNFMQARNDLALTASGVEAEVWEELYGVPSMSAIRVLQKASEINAQTPGSYKFIKNVPLTTANRPSIIAQLGPGMLEQVDFLDSYINTNKRMYSLTDSLTLPSGWVGVAIVLATDTPSDYHHVFITQYTQAAAGSDLPAPLPSDQQNLDLLAPDQTLAAANTAVVSAGTSSEGSTSGGSSIVTAGGGSNAASPTLASDAPAGDGQGSPSDNTGATCPSPVDVGTGAMWHQLTDFKLMGRTPETNIVYQRTYLARPFVASKVLGPNWHDNWRTHMYLANPAKYPAGSVFWLDENGGSWIYQKSSNGSFTLPPGQFATLSEFSDRYELRKKGGVVLTFSRSNAAPFGSLTQITDPHGEKIVLSYGSNQLLSRIYNSFTGGVSFTYDAQNRVIQILRERENFVYTYTYGADGKLSKSTDFTGRSYTYEYNQGQVGTLANGLMSVLTDPLGRKINFSYYDNGKVFEQVEPGNAHRSYFYSPFLGDINTRVLDTDGESTDYRFDSNFRLTEIMAADGGRIAQVWDNSNQLAQKIDELGYVTQMQYDARGNMISLQRPNDLQPTTMTYDATFDKLQSIAPLAGSPLNYTIDSAKGDVLKIQRSDGSKLLSLSMAYDKFGHAIQFTNDRGSFANQTDADGLLTRVFDSRNPETRTYDSRHRLVRRKFSSGRVLSIQYDNLDRVTRVDDSAGPSVINVYDAGDRLVSRTVTDGVTSQITKYTWDDRDRISSVTDSLGRITKYGYGFANLGCRQNDRPTSITDPMGRVTTLEYDSRNRLVRKVSAIGAVTRYEYNMRGDLIALTDAVGNRTTYTRDGNGRVVQSLEPVTITNSDGSSTSTLKEIKYQYDAAGRVVRESSGLQGSAAVLSVREFKYDVMGRLISRVMKKEKNGTVLEVQDSSNFAYQSQLLPEQLKSAYNGVALNEFNNEALPPYSLVAFSQKAAQAGNPLSLIEGEYAISAAQSADIASIAQKGKNPFVVADYDSAGRMQHMRGVLSGNDLEFALSYDSYGRKSAVYADDRLVTKFSYDIANQLTSLAYRDNAAELNESLAYNLNGNITERRHNSGSLTYAYDEADRLISANGLRGGISQALQYDLNGNHTFDSFTGQGQFATNQILADQLHSFASDAEGSGNLVAETDVNRTYQDRFTYRVDGKLSGFERVLGATPNDDDFDDNHRHSDFCNHDHDNVNRIRGQSAQYFFDALGRRVAKKIQIKAKGKVASSFIQSYLYLGNREQILMAKAGDGDLSLYLDRQGADAGMDEHLGEVSSNSSKAYQADHQGSVLNSTAAAGARAYTPFGASFSVVNSINRHSEPVVYGYTGREYDIESGKYYYRARQYDPLAGRFLSKDPIGFEGGDSNLYGYVSNDPINFIDPQGLNKDDINSAIKIVQTAMGSKLKGVKFVTGELEPGTLGEYDPVTKTITISEVFDMNSGSLSNSSAEALLQVVFHEALHTGQSYSDSTLQLYQDVLATIKAGEYDTGAIHKGLDNQALDYAKKYMDFYNQLRKSPGCPSPGSMK